MPWVPAEALWAASLDASLICNEDGRVVAVSPSFVRLLGVAGESVVGRPVTTLFHADDRVTIEAYLARPALADVSYPLRMRFVSDDETIPTEVHVVATPVGEGTGLCLSLLPRFDGGAQQQEATSRALEQLRLIDEMKHRLLESVSHELRTPLTVISGFAETLLRVDFPLDEQQVREMAAAVDRQAARMQRLISDLIDLDRISRGAIIVDKTPCDLTEIVREVVASIGAGDHHIRLELRPVVVPVDRSRIERLVEDLIVNAQRHTPPGTTITLRVTDSGGGALLEVVDDGPGLPDHLRDEAFSPFVQGATFSPEAPGLGLGLALVRRTAELHGGRAWATTPDGGGTALHVRLPAEPSGVDEGELSRVMRTAAALAHRDGERELGAVPAIRPDALGLIGPLLRSARQELGMQVAYLSVFTPDEQVVVAVDGDGDDLGIQDGATFELEDTYCVRMVDGRIGTTVADARNTPEVAQLPGTLAGISAYAGVPVRLPDGHVVGSLCCADTQPQPSLSQSDGVVLRAISKVIGNQLATRELITNDHSDVRERVEAILGRPDRIRVLYQPIVDLRSGGVVGVEALSRFPDSSVRPPDTWFADAGRVGLGTQLDQVALLRALRGLDELPADCYLSLNITPETVIGGGLRPLLGRVPLERLVLEITEHAAVSDYDRLRSALHPFRAAGARLAIDDVGSGFASLRHVMRTEPDVIKIDRSMVSNVATDSIQRAVANALATVASQLGAYVVAEGIEDVATLEVLVSSGITHGQGWLFSEALPLPLTTMRYDTFPRN